MTSIKEVAKKAGVSTATVSAVINQNKYVSEELRLRIEDSIEELNYRPNRVARRLKGKKTNLIGVTVTELTNPFYPNMLKGIENLAYQQNYNLILSTTGDDEDKEYRLLESMLNQGVDGIILSTVDNHESNTLKLVEDENIPYILINRAPAHYNHSMVCVDSIKVGETATEKLIQLGHERISFVGGKRQNSFDREKGFRKAMNHHGLKIDESLIIDGDYDSNKTYKIAKKLYELPKDIRPTAIFAASDMMAFAVARGYLDNGAKIPEEISIIGADNIPFSKDFRIPLTTVDVQSRNIGRRGFELLNELIKNKGNYSHQQILLDPKLIERSSTLSIL
ncbi:transcriptional regulator, LacI family [Natribacillus halophilus]|uniref:Transcriptional regulator, LacI family n=2 Tax=Natribacillus halophilus TaxID=549003 RepID=A0A1G8MK17_9BACI|nr:transcriptional regulator, LacI family [Natribacillus halophilus]